MSFLHIPPFGGIAGMIGDGEGSETINVSEVDEDGDRDGGHIDGDRSPTSRSQAVPIAMRDRDGVGGGGFGATRVTGGGPGPGVVLEGGGMAQRQLSRSHFVPRNLEGYERHMRHIHCEGYLWRKSKSSDNTWRRRWFLLKDGTLSYFHDKEEAGAHQNKASGAGHPQRLLPMDQVEAVRTEVRTYCHVFRVISSDREDMVLRADSKDEMNMWLFGFHRVLATIIARLVESPPRCPVGTGEGGGGGGGGAGGGGRGGGGGGDMVGAGG
ncbi:unnamed protein product, partial [Discosporangium mesarthrocarpum]